VNGSAPEPATNRDFSRALGRALRRPAIAPIPAAALKLLYGEMGQIVIEGVRMVPGRAGELGYGFRHPDLDEALRSTLA
jgi:NAD dependent epimerase/dehydratase family enzyme